MIFSFHWNPMEILFVSRRAYPWLFSCRSKSWLTSMTEGFLLWDALHCMHLWSVSWTAKHFYIPTELFETPQTVLITASLFQNSENMSRAWVWEKFINFFEIRFRFFWPGSWDAWYCDVRVFSSAYFDIDQRLCLDARFCTPCASKKFSCFVVYTENAALPISKSKVYNNTQQPQTKCMLQADRQPSLPMRRACICLLYVHRVAPYTWTS